MLCNCAMGDIVILLPGLMDRPPGRAPGLVDDPGTAPGLMDIPGTTGGSGLITKPPGLKIAPRGLRCWGVIFELGISICRPPLIIGCCGR